MGALPDVTLTSQVEIMRGNLLYEWSQVGGCCWRDAAGGMLLGLWRGGAGRGASRSPQRQPALLCHSCCRPPDGAAACPAAPLPQVRAAVGDASWRPQLDDAVALFQKAGCSESDIRGALKNHTQVGSRPGDGLAQGLGLAWCSPPGRACARLPAAGCGRACRHAWPRRPLAAAPPRNAIPPNPAAGRRWSSWTWGRTRSRSPRRRRRRRRSRRQRRHPRPSRSPRPRGFPRWSARRSERARVREPGSAWWRWRWWRGA